MALVLGALKIFASSAAWRLTGSTSMGRILLRELGSRDENLRTIAGMLLVKAGARAVPLLREALEQRQHLPIVLSIIGDLGDRSLAPELRHLSGDRDPQVAKAAQDALRVLQVQ